MNERMVYRFGRKAFLWALFVFSFVTSCVHAQRYSHLSFLKDGDTEQWSIDLSDLIPGEAMYLIVSDTSQWDHWTEINGKSLPGLFDYAMPRFVLQYDSFDCLERTLMTRFDSLQDHVRGSGEILGIPGSPLRQPAASRGQEQNLEIRILGAPEASAILTFGEASGCVVEIRLKETAKKEKRILLFQLGDNTVPQCYYKQDEKYLPSTVHLFAMDEGGRILARNGGKSPATVLLPPKVMEQRSAFQDTLLQYWSVGLDPVLVYSWDIGLSGGDKCFPCVAPPPDFTLLHGLGLDSMPEHLYVSYLIISPSASRELSVFPFEAGQWIFEMLVPARGFLNCPEAEDYLKMVQKRQETERQNLLDVMGPKAGFFID